MEYIKMHNFQHDIPVNMQHDKVSYTLQLCPFGLEQWWSRV
jgi:hypothetical protein